MVDCKSCLCMGICALFLGIVVMSIALIATSLRKLDSDEGMLSYFVLLSTNCFNLLLSSICEVICTFHNFHRAKTVKHRKFGITIV